MHWMKISCILCMFGCFKDFRPSESFITDYLTGPWKNFTVNEVNHEIYPVATYSYLSILILMFLIIDFVRYKPIIILCGLSGTITFLLIMLGKIVLVLQIANFFLGLFFSTEIAFWTYIYAKVDKKHYQEMTSYTRAASLFGRSISSIIAQLTTSFNLLNYHQLNYLTVSALVIATIWSFFLPSVGQSIYFHRTDISNDNGTFPVVVQKMIGDQSQQLNDLQKPLCNNESKSESKHRTLTFRNIKNAYVLLWKHFVQAYTNCRVLKWCAWCALTSCGFLLVVTYSQLLWQTAVKPGDKIYNGAVDFVYAIIGAISVFIIGKIQLNWVLLGDIICALLAFVESAIILASSYVYNIWFLYAGYVIFVVIYHTMINVASFEIAKCISEDSYALIFGVNTFLALVMQSLLITIVNALMLNIRQQFCIYGGYFMILAVIYLILAVINFVQYF